MSENTRICKGCGGLICSIYPIHRCDQCDSFEEWPLREWWIHNLKVQADLLEALVKLKDVIDDHMDPDHVEGLVGDLNQADAAIKKASPLDNEQASA